jgi:hypothetical protein
MFELHVVVAGIVMFNILELIMEIVPNYPTGRAFRLLNNTQPSTVISISNAVLRDRKEFNEPQQ